MDKELIHYDGYAIDSDDVLCGIVMGEKDVESVEAQMSEILRRNTEPDPHRTYKETIVYECRSVRRHNLQ